jgi:hypothetical protein
LDDEKFIERPTSMSDLRDILARLDSIAESDITPVNLSNGLNKQQKSVPELPALFKPKTISVLGAKTDPEHPMKGYAVGACEDVEDEVDEDTSSFDHELDLDAKQLQLDPIKPVSEQYTQEDVISTVKKKLGDYLKNIQDEIRSDSDLKDKTAIELDRIGPAVRTITTDDGHDIKIHGNEDDGFRITVKNKPHSAKFETLKHAEIACEMFCARRKNITGDADYLDEKQ